MRLGEVLWSEVSHKKTTFNPAVFPSKKTRFKDMPGRQHGQPRTFLVFVAAETVDCGFTAARADLLRAQYVSSHGSSSSGEGALPRRERYAPHPVQRWTGGLGQKLHLGNTSTGPPESPQRL